MFKILFGEGWVRDKAVKGIVVVLGLSWGVVVGMDGIPCCCCCRCCCRWRSRLLLVLWAVEYKAGGGSLVGGPSLPMLDPLIDLSLEQTTLSSPSPFPQSSAHQSNRDPHHRTIKAISARRNFFVFSVNFIPFWFEFTSDPIFHPDPISRRVIECKSSTVCKSLVWSNCNWSTARLASKIHKYK